MVKRNRSWRVWYQRSTLKKVSNNKDDGEKQRTGQGSGELNVETQSEALEQVCWERWWRRGNENQTKAEERRALSIQIQEKKKFAVA